MKHFFWHVFFPATASVRRSAARRSIWRIACAVLWLPVILGGLTGCSPPSAEEARANRHGLSAKNYKEGRDISLAVVWNQAGGEFFAGAQLAAEEINAEGGVQGHRIRLDYIDEAPFLQREGVARSRAEGRYRNARQEAGVDIAKTVVANPNVTAVIGHTNTSETTFSAMLTYQDNGILFLSGGMSDSRIMWSGKSLFFQLRPQDTVLAEKMAAEIKKRKWETIFYIYEDTRHNEQLGELLKAACANAGIKFAGSLAIMPGLDKNPAETRRVQNSVADLRDDDLNAIVLIAPPALGAEIIHQSRTLGVLQPFFGTGELDSSAFFKRVGENGADVLITSLHHPKKYLVRRFAENFKKRFPDTKLDEAALIGYDSVRLYADGVAGANTTEPYLVANALLYKLPVWYGLLGAYSFNEANSINLKYSTRRLTRTKDGQQEFVSVEE